MVQVALVMEDLVLLEVEEVQVALEVHHIEVVEVLSEAEEHPVDFKSNLVAFFNILI